MNQGRLVGGGLMAVAGAGIALAVLVSRKSESVRAEVQSRTAEVSAGPRVRVSSVQAGAPTRMLTLMGEARPYVSVTLYAKVSGYLKEIRVDRGDRVKTNQLLAIIESPELDAQYNAGEADARNKRLNAKRLRDMRSSDASSEQQTQQAEADADVAEANVKTLEAMRTYRELHAPFDGTVTARYADPGSLVQSAANSQTSSLPLVTISQTDRLRVSVYVDQTSAPFVRAGTPVEITLPDRSDVKINATVARISGTLDPRTRTLLAEIDLDNRAGTIVPGSFVQVALRVKQDNHLQIPVAALVVRGDTTLVPVVDGDNRVHYKRVSVSGTDGSNVQVLAGLAVGDRIAMNLGESVADGSKVQPVEK
jgi:RND family efflux transporter MFP subunit